MGFEPNPALLAVALPVGISFYTFQTLSYTIDVYRGTIGPCRDFLLFALFVAYFPQLVAGPIERAASLLPQLESERSKPGRDRMTSAVLLILVGLFKKVALADPLASVVDAAFGRAAVAGGLELWIGAIAFAVQAYCDFSGYSDIARGSSRLLGIELIHNFTQPFLSRNITELWQRWHISLTKWFRDYVYIPLGGNRRGGWTLYRNIIATMALSGLWHGAGWHWIVWGVSQGLLLSLHRRFGAGTAIAEPLRLSLSQIGRILSTFLLFVLTVTLFRAESVEEAAQMVEGMLTLRPGPVFEVQAVFVLYGLAAMYAIDIVHRKYRDPLLLLSRRPALAGAACGVAVSAVVFFSGTANVPFIYFQF